MKRMKRIMMVALALMCLITTARAQTVQSPDGNIVVTIAFSEGGKPHYQVSYQGQEVLGSSALGVVTNIGDFTHNLQAGKVESTDIDENYELRNIKQRRVHYVARQLTVPCMQNDRHVMDIIVRVSNRDVAFCYRLLPQKDTRVCVVNSEASSFVLPDGTTTFLCPQSKPMTGFARTAPSYETPYQLDQPVGNNGWGEGFTFPCLFKTANSQWVLISETGTDGNYVGCRLLNDGGGHYKIGFPMAGEMNGAGSTTATLSLPGQTPWRTITVGPLAHIVETTAAFDLVQRKYEPSQAYVYGKGTWSWIIGMDASCNYDEQKRYIDFAAAMGYKSVLVDAFWDKQIGYDRIAELARYGLAKGVGLFLWYNSNGSWNDAPQTPIGKMNNARIRREEMKWMKDNGIRGIKVDFFGGDKQPMMQLYEDILSDANDYGLLCIFHGCTLPRGWERMYPNYVASEAVLASENLHFGQAACDAEARNACIHPFVRNTIGSMDFGGSALNKRYSADNQHGTIRRTSDVFALATAVLFQSAVQHFALAPNNQMDAPQWAVQFMKRVPTTWDEVRFIDGYPGKYVILARRHGLQWYVAGINADEKPLKKTIPLNMFTRSMMLNIYSDDARLQGSMQRQKVGSKKRMEITIPCNGAIVICNEVDGEQRIVENGGTGPFKAVMTDDPSLPAHTLFVPTDSLTSKPILHMPVLVWGNGACANSPFEHYKFLNEIASHGFLVVATGYMPEGDERYVGPMSTSEQQIEAIDWLYKQNKNPHSPYYQRIALGHICLAGMSCGGLQSLFNCADPRISSLMICNSGLFKPSNAASAVGGMPMPPKSKLKEIHTPVFYILGGESDIAYENGMDDFRLIDHVPACVANYPVGHGGTYAQPHGGEFAVAALAWLKWQLKFDREAASMFMGDDCGLSRRKGWTLQKNAKFDELR